MNKQITAAEKAVETASFLDLKPEAPPSMISPALPLEANTAPSIPTPAAKRPAKARPRLDRERLKCRWECPSAVAKEVISLARRWAAEIEQPPFDPDWDRVFLLERMNAASVWTARHEDVLVGFMFVTLTRSLFIDAKIAKIEVGYLVPEWREGMQGFSYVKDAVKELLAISDLFAIEWETNDTFEPDTHGRARLAKLLERLKFKQVGTMMSLRR